MEYSLVTYRSGDEARSGLLAGERLTDVVAATGNAHWSSMLGILRDWKAADARFAELASSGALTGEGLDWSRLLAPIEMPPAIYCAGANYADHVAEMFAKNNLPPEPDPHELGLKAWHFIKSSHAIAGPGATIGIPAPSKRLDWEVELAAVIGRTAKNVSEADALSYVAGYTIANDLSARDLGKRPPLAPTNPFHTDWLAHKSFDGSCPLGPWIVPARSIADPQNLGIRLWVNGVLKQDSNTSQMIFTLSEQIAQLSLRITLHPGDVILTGTPAGVGAGRGEFLAAGDKLELWCEGIGTLKHTIG
jgi:2-keto-4-pentenoate hydratase/2-oxohepta-3-ene-1,7-dioic acid hydratase in catechol pathway